MCGIVCYYGRCGGVERVLNALDLLAYRAPDSSGLAVLGVDGQLAVRQAVGTAEQLREELRRNPLPLLFQNDFQVVLGHGRWAMVGAVTETNTHPISDRGLDRVVCENGSHNASLMLSVLVEQEEWWRARGLSESKPVHRTQNTTEVIAYEWERMVYLLNESEPPEEYKPFLDKLAESGVIDVEERALRLAIWRLRHGNAHACAFLSRLEPDTLYVTSHDKPIALISCTDSQGRPQFMVASDVNAALTFWSREEVEAAVAQIADLERDGADAAAINVILDRFAVDVIFLDDHLNQGQELFARISPRESEGRVEPSIEISRYDGFPVAAVARPIRLNPTLVGKRGYASYTESHIAEIPDVVDRILAAYVQDGRVHMESTWRNGELFAPGLNLDMLRKRFGERLTGLKRVLLIGEGSSWRDAQAAAPLLRELLTGVLVNIYRPIQVLNLGEAIDPVADLAVEISWSGTTDSLLKVDKWLAELNVLRVAVTGRPQSDLGRRTASSGGTVDVLTGVEVSVATVKGYQGILLTLDLLALQLSELSETAQDTAKLIQLLHEISLVLPEHLRATIKDEKRRERLRQVAQTCQRFNKYAVIGSSPVDIEGELKIEELAQVVARTFGFHDADLRAVVERTALVSEEAHRTLFIINATTTEAQKESQFILNYLRELDVRCLVHTTPHDRLADWQALSNADVFVSPPVSEVVQPLIDAPLYFELAVALAYARGLSALEIDRPRNLAKSVTTTGAEKRAVAEARREFRNMDMKTFGNNLELQNVSSHRREVPTQASFRATVSLRSALAVILEDLPTPLALEDLHHLVVVADTAATENGARMAEAAWQALLGVDLVTYRRFIGELPQVPPDTALLRIIRAGSVLAVRDRHTISLPSDLSPLQLELLTAVYLVGLAVRLARHQGEDTTSWEIGLAQLPLLIAQVYDDAKLANEINQVLAQYVANNYDKVQIVGGGQDFTGASSIARSLRLQGFMAEALYTDSAWHGPLATVGGPDAEHDTLIVILATDPLFQAAALVDTQVYRTRLAKVILVVPEGNQELLAVRGVDPSAVLAIASVPRPFLPVIHATVGDILARQMALLWEERDAD